MTQREREFATLFNALWYKDFPITKDFLGFGTRAGWTLHIASAVRDAANLMGLFMTFETGKKTDGEIHMFDESAESERKTWAKVEWEWNQATGRDVNEFEKLKEAGNNAQCQVAIFIGRYRTEKNKKGELIERISNHWKDAKIPLLCFLLEATDLVSVSSSSGKKKAREFGALTTYRFASKDKHILSRRLRTQPAYPWNVKGTKWAAHRSNALPGSLMSVDDEVDSI